MIVPKSIEFEFLNLLRFIMKMICYPLCWRGIVFWAIFIVRNNSSFRYKRVLLFLLLVFYARILPDCAALTERSELDEVKSARAREPTWKVQASFHICE